MTRARASRPHLLALAGLLVLAGAACSSDGPPSDAGVEETDAEGVPSDTGEASTDDATAGDGVATDAGGDDTGPTDGDLPADSGVPTSCTAADDCPSRVCRAHVCAAPSCFDGVLNGTETDVDCGGACGACVRPDAPAFGTDLAESTRFLHEGPGAVQVGVAPGTIEARRAAVLFGTVTDRDGQPLTGVEVTVLGHPELGHTNTRAEGRFDLVANGGGTLTVTFKKPGFLPAQRTLQVPWRELTAVDDVALVPLDPAVTTIDFSTPIQVARGTPSVDEAGARQATLLFRRGTRATMELPDGTTRVLPSLSARATEYTVGPNGPAAMPAKLPPTSAYTYAVELSVDEAIAAGAVRVTFDRTVALYVDDFLHFPVGSRVPTGYYDPQKAAWVPSDDGLVVSVLAIRNGAAQLDVAGEGRVATTRQLQDLGITHDELVSLASLYAEGAELWRVPVTHFSSWDCNWPYGLPDDAERPDAPDEEEEEECDPCEKGGSIVDCENLTLGESVPVAGTPFSLHYRSDRLPGRTTANTVNFKVTKGTVPASLRQVIVQVTMAGRRYRQVLPPLPNQSYAFVWDGLDAYGRRPDGKQPGLLEIGYTYPAQYMQIEDVLRSFAAVGGATFTGSGFDVPGAQADRARREITLWRESTFLVHGPDVRVKALGGWSLSPHHDYDPRTQTLYGGDGTTRRGTSVLGTVRSVPGSGACGAGRLAVAPDGSVFVSNGTSCADQVWRVWPDGHSTLFAGTGVRGDGGDGGPAVDADLGMISALAIGPDGSVYIGTAEGSGSSRYIRRVRLDGIIETIAGGPYGSAGDNGPASDARFIWVRTLAVAPDGTIYIGDDNRIRRITPDGIITHVAGNGDWGWAGEGGPATEAPFQFINQLTIEPDGSVLVATSPDSTYASDGGTVRRITPDGRMHTLAGSAGAFMTGLATQAGGLAPWGVARDRDGRLFIASEVQGALLLVDTDGYLTQVTGFGTDNGENVPFATYGIPAWSNFADPTFGPDGNLYFSRNDKLRMATVALPGYTTGEIAIPSETGRELFVFDHRGRHRRTLDAFTGALEVGISYDADGRLLAVTDRSNNLTRVERDASGVPTAIVAPGGQRTSLTVSPDGYLTSIVDPAGRATRLAYSPGGLLSQLTEPGGGVHHFTYDAQGRLARDEGPDGAWQSLSRSVFERTTTVTLTTSGGKTTRFVTERLHDGTRRRTRIDPSNLTSVTDARVDGTTQTTQIDGTRVVERVKSDPRWGMNAPYAGTRTVTTPAGLVLTTETTRTTTPEVLASPLDLERWEETTTSNGGPPERLVFDRAAGTFTRTSPAGRVEVTRVDAFGRPAEVTAAGDAAATLTYGAAGLLTAITRATGGEVRTTAWAYDGEGRPTSITGPDGRVTGLAYADASARPSQLVLPGGGTMVYAYDADGNPVSVTPPGGAAHEYGYTRAGLLARYTPPRVGSAADTVTYAVGPDREPTGLTLPDGRAVTYAYDAGGRLATESFSRGVLAYTYSSGGQLASVSAPDETLAFDHDGALPIRTTFSGTVAGSVEVTYDALMRPASERVNGGSSATFTYDADGLLLGAGALTITRDPHSGRVVATTLGGVTTEQGFDAFGDVVTFSATAGTLPLASWAYAWDPSGRLASVTESMEGAPEVVFEYDRDAAGRLTSVRKDGLVEALYTYDARGNRTEVTEGARVESATYDAQDRVLTRGRASYVFARSGHVAEQVEGGATTTFVYDEHGNLTEVVRPGATIRYVVDGQDRRVAKLVNGVFARGYLYRGVAPVAEVDVSGAIVARFIYGTSSTVPDYVEKDGARYRLVTDRVGSVRLVVDESGGVVERLEYSAWGEVLTDSSPGFQPFGFAGGLYDPDTKLVHFWARDYDPAAGRWTARDPLGFNGGSTNLYAYVRNDPVSTRDPEGLSPADVQKIIDAARARTNQMTREGQRMDPGWLNNMSSALPMLDGALGCPLGICQKAKSGCREQSMEVLQALTQQMKDKTLQTDAKWTIEQEFVLPVHYRLEARSSDPRDPVLVLDPWKNTFTTTGGR